MYREMTKLDRIPYVGGASLQQSPAPVTQTAALTHAEWNAEAQAMRYRARHGHDVEISRAKWIGACWALVAILALSAWGALACAAYRLWLIL
jgi:hypothetical protein